MINDISLYTDNSYYVIISLKYKSISVFHVLWDFMVIFNRTPSQNLTGISSIHTHSCHFPLKWKHTIINPQTL